MIDRLHTKSLKLADFGLAVTVREPLFTVCGTPTYVAPEILAETGYGVKVGRRNAKTGFCVTVFVIFEHFRENGEEIFVNSENEHFRLKTIWRYCMCVIAVYRI